MFWVRVIDCWVDDTKQKVDYWIELDDCYRSDIKEIEDSIVALFDSEGDSCSLKWEIGTPPAEVVERKLHRAVDIMNRYKQLIGDYEEELANIHRKDN
jgi:hypothetical protein